MDDYGFREKFTFQMTLNYAMQFWKFHHKPTASGHPGPKRMHLNLLRGYFWPGMRQDVIRYANFCRSCHRAKAKRQGLLQPLPVPQHRWMDITMDFIVDLPVCIRRGRQHRHLM